MEAPMASHPKTRALALTQNARLKELLMLFDCRDEIASFDVEAFATRAGELIGKAQRGKQNASRRANARQPVLTGCETD